MLRRKPAAKPRDESLLEARKRTHLVLDALWKDGGMTRSEAYILACKLMGRPRKRMHVSMLGKEECEELALRLGRFLKKGAR